MTDKFILYLKITGGIVLSCLIIVGSVNWLVDPYNELGRNWTGCYFQTERQHAAAFVRTFPHDAVLMGSSRTLHIDPDHLCNYKFFNASFSSALPEEIYYYLKKFAKDERLVVIGLDFYMFNERSFPLKKMNKWPDHYWSVHEYLLGWQVFIDSIKAVYYWKHQKTRNPINGYTPIVNDPVADMKKYHHLMEFLANTHYADFQLSRERMGYMRLLKQVLDSRHIKYIIFINPIQEDNWQLLYKSGSYKTFLQWENDLKEIFPDLREFPEGRYSNRDLYQNSDPIHYLTTTGAVFTNEMLGCGK